MIDLATLDQLGGVASAHQLRAAGASSGDLTAAVHTGALRRIRKGYYATGAASPAAVAAVLRRGRLSCVSAARSYGLWAGDDGRLHLQFGPKSRAGPHRDHVRHWFAGEANQHVWRVSLDDCLRSVARCADEETAVAVFDTAISAGLTSPPVLRRILARQPVNVRARALLARPGSDSGVESIARQRLEAQGHIVEQQLHVPGVGRVDMRIDGLLYLEVDGFAFHGDRAAFERDRLRDATLGAAGHLRMRVSAAQVRDEWPAVLGRIERILTHSANSQERRDQPGHLACSIY